MVGVRVTVGVTGVLVGVTVGQFAQGVLVRVGVRVGPWTGGTSQSLCTMVIFLESRAPHVPQPLVFETGS
jgi:hypothetical protein